MKLMRDIADKKLESVNAECDKKITGLNEEIKILKKKVSELEAKQSQANLPSDDEKEDKGVKIKVEGCGIPEINGTYKQCGLYHDKPKFSKKGSCDGEDAEFTIYNFRWDGTFYWWISFEDNSEFLRHCHSEIRILRGSSDQRCVHISTGSEIDFYKVRTFPDADLPHRDGWELSDRGVDPPPCITVLGNDN
jgi:hypothetical protein